MWFSPNKFQGSPQRTRCQSVRQGWALELDRCGHICCSHLSKRILLAVSTSTDIFSASGNENGSLTGRVELRDDAWKKSGIIHNRQEISTNDSCFVIKRKNLVNELSSKYLIWNYATYAHILNSQMRLHCFVIKMLPLGLCLHSTSQVVENSFANWLDPFLLPMDPWALRFCKLVLQFQCIFKSFCALHSS